MIALSNPPDLFLRLMSDLKDFYCENDFLLDSKAVLLLSHKYQELQRAVTILDGYGDQYQEKTTLLVSQLLDAYAAKTQVEIQTSVNAISAKKDKSLNSLPNTLFQSR